MKDRRSGTDGQEGQPEGICPVDGHPEGSGDLLLRAGGHCPARMWPACQEEFFFWPEMRARPPVE